MKRSISDYKSNFRSNSKTSQQCLAQDGAQRALTPQKIIFTENSKRFDVGNDERR